MSFFSRIYRPLFLVFLGLFFAFAAHATAPNVTNVTSSTANGTYKLGDTISIQVVFDQTVHVNGSVQLQMNDGNADVFIGYVSGHNTNTLNFDYVVQYGDTSSDLDYLSTGSLDDMGMAITDVTDTDHANTTLPSPGAAGSLGANKALVIDGIPPYVTNITSSTCSSTCYKKAGDVISIQLTWNETVNVTGTPQLTLETGTTDAVVNYASGTGTSTLTFTYTVASGQDSADLDAASLALNGGTIKDAALNTASLSLPAGGMGDLAGNEDIIVDTTVPTVSDVTSDFTGNGSYKAGDTIEIDVHFSEYMDVTGTPQLTLETGTTDRVVNFSSTNGTAVVFNYTVQTGDLSADLDYLSTSALALNSGTIKDFAGNNGTLTLASPGATHSLGANQNIIVDAVAPTITNVTSSTANGNYTNGQTVSIQVVFSEVVNASFSVVPPQLTLETGGTDEVVDYVSGNGTNTFNFTYTVQAGDTSSDLDYVGTTSFYAGDGSILDNIGNSATLTLPSPGAAGSLGANKAITINQAASSDVAQSAYRFYDQSSALNPTSALANQDTAATVSVGDKKFRLRMALHANTTLSSSAGTFKLQFATKSGTCDTGFSGESYADVTTSSTGIAYYNQSGLADADALSSALLSHSGHTMRAESYEEDNNFSNNVTITNGEDGEWDFSLQATGTSNTTYCFRVINSDTTNLTSYSVVPEIIVSDSTAPTVSNVTSSTSNGSYKAGDAVSVQVVFSEVVYVTGTPQLTLETGTTDRTVNYASGSGTDTLTFTYTVQSGDTSADLDYVGTTSLALNSGTIKDLVTNNATLTLVSPGAAGSLGANKAIIIDTTASTVSGVTSSTSNGSYKAGDAISIQVNFSETVNVTGTPQLTLETGATDRTVNYASGSGSSSLTFTYTVQSGDTSADLDYVATNSLALNSGTIRDAALNDATLTLASPGATNSLGANKAIIIDTTAPTVTNVTSSTSNATYKIGDSVSIQITFSESVTVTGTPQLTLETGSTDRAVDYASGSGSATLTFTYTVQSGDNSSDLDYVGTTSLALNSGTIKDAALNAATLTLASPGAAGSLGANKALVIDGVVPTVSGVTSSTSNGSYKAGDVISIQVNFSDTVNVTGTPQLTLETGTTDEVVNYASGTGTSSLTFTYTVQSGDTSADLDYASTTALALNSGTIKDVNGNDATLTLASPGATNSLGANKAIIIDTTAPTVTNVTSSTSNATYKAGDSVSIQVTFSESVTVTGTPQLTLETGTTDEVVNYASGSGTSSLTFTYTVQSGDTSADLDYASTNALALNSGTIKDAALNSATLTLASPGASGSLGANKNIVIDTTSPTVTGVTSSTSNGYYNSGDQISIQINFSEAVTVSMTASLLLETGATDRTAVYATGSGTSTLNLIYMVQAGDTSADLDYVATNSLTLGGGTLRDAAGNDATLTLASPGVAGSLGANKDLVIDNTAPTISNVTSSTSNGTYGATSVISIQIVFSEAMLVTGTPQLTLETGTTDEVVNYTSGSGTSSLTFDYTVQAGDTSADLDYKDMVSLALNGGTLTDLAGNTLFNFLPIPGAAGSLGANKNIVISTSSPSVTNVTSSTSNGSYKVGDTVSIQITFSASVDVTGTPQLTLETGATDRVVNYASGSGSATLTFTYTVQSGDTSADLDYVGTTSLTLNSGTIKDAGSNDATLTLATPGASGSLGANKAIIIDTTAPTVSGVTSSTSNGSYKAGDTVSIQVNFSETVNVTGTPQLTLETGTTDEVVNYASGTGTSSLTFTYTVQSGDTSADLDYTSTTALALNSGTIRDVALNNATLTLASPGATNSLGANKAIVIDTTAPTVSSVNSSTTNGSYKAGDTVSIQVNFSESVTVTGTPQLTLETGTTDEVVNYASGTGTSSLTFTYTVQSGDTSADLDYVGTTSLALNSGTIKDAALNNATLTLASPGASNSLGANEALVIDTTAPTVTNVTSSSTNGTYGTGAVIPIQIVFSESVTVTGTPRLTLETGSTDAVVDYTSGSGSNTLVFNYTVGASDIASDLDYVTTTSLALNSGTIKDTALNSATLTLVTPGASGSLGANKNIVIASDTTSPTVTNITSSTTNGSYKIGDVVAVQVVFSENVVVTGTPQITLETGTTDRTVNYTSGSGSDTLLFNYTIQSGDTSSDLDYVVTTSLTLNSGTIKDNSNNNAVLTLPSPGAAGSLGANKAIVVDGVLPTVSLVTSSTANGSYKADVVIHVDVNFSEAVVVTGTPQITLSTGSPSTTAINYTSGSGTSTLTFDYTIVSGNTSADLDYAGTTSLALNSGTIKDAAGNNATLTLATPGATNSLGNNKNIIVDTTPPTLDSILTTRPSGTYKIGDTITLNVIFSENVTTNSGVTVQLLDGNASTVIGTCNIPVISTSDVATCNFVVAEGQNFATGLNAKRITMSSLTDIALNELASPAFASVTIYPIKTVLVDADRPAITLVGSNSVTINRGEVYVDPGATALDSFDGNITSSIVAVNLVDTNNPGTYVVTYDVSDAAGNTAFQVTRTVTVNGSVSGGGGGGGGSGGGGSGGGGSGGGGSGGGGSGGGGSGGSGGGGSSGGGGGSTGGGSTGSGSGLSGAAFNGTGSTAVQSFTGIVSGSQADFIAKLIIQINLLKEQLVKALAKQIQAPKVTAPKVPDTKAKTPTVQQSLSGASYLDKLCAFRYGQVGPQILWLQREFISLGLPIDTADSNSGEGMCWSDKFDRLVRNVQLVNGILSPENPEFGCVGRVTLDWLNNKDKSLKLYYNLGQSKPLNKELLTLYPCSKTSRGEKFAPNNVLEGEIIKTGDYTTNSPLSYFGRLNSTIVTAKATAFDDLSKSIESCLIREGDEGPVVKQVQKSLNVLGFLVSAQAGAPGSIGNETERFAAATTKALKAFQKSKAMPQIGCVDQQTLDALQSGSKALSKKTEAKTTDLANTKNNSALQANVLNTLLNKKPVVAPKVAPKIAPKR